MGYKLIKVNNKKRVSILDIAMIVCGAVLLFTSAWLPGMLLLISALIGILAKKPEQFVVNEHGIDWIAFRKKSYSWQIIDRVILKDSILTIDLENNILIQAEVKMQHPLIEESVFNEYCEEIKSLHPSVV